MGELKRKILDIIFWIALVVGLVMVIWRIFGDSPSDLAIIFPFIILLISKMWTMNDGFNNFKYNVKSGFDKVKEDMSRIESKIDNINKKLRRK